MYVFCKTECSICMEPVETRKEGIITQCKHVFHKSCLKKWEKSKAVGCKTCPVCRAHIFKDKIFEKIKSNELEFLRFMQYALISLTSIEILSEEDIRIEVANKKKYDKMISNSPGLTAIIEKYGAYGTVTDTQFMIEKNRINFELMKYDLSFGGVHAVRPEGARDRLGVVQYTRINDNEFVFTVPPEGGRASVGGVPHNVARQLF